MASATFGSFGSAPSSNDSAASLNGQMWASAGVTAAGIVTDLKAGIEIGGGIALAPFSDGATLAVSAAGVGEAVVGTLAVAGGAKNATAVADAMSNRAGDFKPSTREGAIKANAESNGGSGKCENCGQDVKRVANQKGQRPPGNQLQVHHDPPINEGGGKNSKPVVLCRDCHEDIHNP